MKTITLDDVAYQRLKAWKRATHDSFSQVVKRMVPEAGTLGALAQFAKQNVPHEPAKDDLLEQSVEQRSPAKSEPWT